MMYSYTPRGVCAQRIDLDVEDGIVRTVKIYGGCSGNSQGLSRLAEGRPVDDIIALLKGIRCGMKPTSCPDQLANALELLKNG